MKKISQKCMIFLTSFFLCFLLCATTVKANSGPPANVQITVTNYEVPFFFDLLIYKNSLLTPEEIDEATEKILHGSIDLYHKEYPLALASYQDSEGYVSNTLYGFPEFFYATENEDESVFVAKMVLEIPREFKILLYTETGDIITSELITMSQFDYRLTFDLANVDMSVDQSNVGVVSGFIGNPWWNISTWINFLLRMLLTLGIELGLLYVFGFRRKNTFFFVTGMNILTQIGLNIVTISVFYQSYSNGYRYITAFVIGELLVFAVEAVLISLFVKENKPFRRIAYSLCANIVSMIIGLLLASSLSFLV